MTDEQTLLKLLLTGREEIELPLRSEGRIGIVGGSQTLKKKIHLGLVAIVMESLGLEIRERR